MKAKEIIVRFTLDGEEQEVPCPWPADCLPAKADRVFFHGFAYECIGRELRLEDGNLLLVKIELQADPATPRGAGIQIPIHRVSTP